MGIQKEEGLSVLWGSASEGQKQPGRARLADVTASDKHTPLHTHTHTAPSLHPLICSE